MINLIKQIIFHSPVYKIVYNAYAKIKKYPVRIIRNKGKSCQFKDFDLNITWNINKFRMPMYSRGLKTRSYELCCSYFIDKIDLQTGDNIIDVGANSGDLKVFLAWKQVGLNYFGFEPSRLDYDNLIKNQIININSHEYNVSISNQNGSSRFYLDSDDANSSLIEIKFYSDVVETITETLDSFSARMTFSKVKLLKIDAEGAEPEVIDGAKNMLRITQYVAFDGGPERGIENLETWDQVNEQLVNAGFQLIYGPRNFDKRSLYINKLYL
jgi:FkbM family methyltransferase